MQALRPRHGGATRQRRRGSARLILGLLLAAAIPIAAAQSSAELVDAARKEGSVNVYTSNAAPTIQALVADFEKRYAVRVNLWRASSIKVLPRIAAGRRSSSTFSCRRTTPSWSASRTCRSAGPTCSTLAGEESSAPRRRAASGIA